MFKAKPTRPFYQKIGGSKQKRNQITKTFASKLETKLDINQHILSIHKMIEGLK